jgi:tRNA wybutosine-synthesizing protein 3
MTKEKDFFENKNKVIEKLEKDKYENKVDEGIISTLDIINKSKNYYTSSSCFGRIVLLEIPVIGDKKNAKFLGKWHRNIISDEILFAAQKAKKGQLWLLAQSPIIHITSKNKNAADKILKIAIACGFKNSGLKSIDRNIVIEVCSTERLDAPVGKDGKLYCNMEYLNLLVEIANDVIEKSSFKLHKLEDQMMKKL